MRLVHEFCQCDPLVITESRLRDYILHVKTVKRWKPKTIRLSAAVLCGVRTYELMEEFAELREDWLRKWLKLPNGIPPTSNNSSP